MNNEQCGPCPSPHVLSCFNDVESCWLQDLLHMLGVIKQLQATHSLRGGALNQEHFFQPIYQMLLAIHTAAFCCLSPTVRVSSPVS